MANYQDPKVTTTRGGMGRWIWIALAVIVALVLAFWLFGNDTVETTTTVIEEPAATETAPAAEPATPVPAAPAD